MRLHPLRKPVLFEFIALIVCIAIAEGCASARYHVEAGPPGDVLLLPPTVTAPASDGPFLIDFRGAKAGADCSQTAEGFELRTGANYLAVTKHAAAIHPAQGATSLQPGAVIEGRQRMAGNASQELAAALDRLMARGCLPLYARPDPVTRVLQAVPLASDEIADISGGDPMADGWVPLRLGEQLRITAPLIGAKGEWRGATTLWYGLTRAKGGQLAIIPPPKAAVNVVRGGQHLHAQALDLPVVPVASYLRMVIFGWDNGVKQVNMLVGAPDAVSMDAATALVQTQSDGCARVAAPAWCAAPRYGTVINIELAVRVQGRWLALPQSSDVGEAIHQAQPGTGSGAPPGLRVLRPYHGRLIPVSGKPSDQLLRLILLGGEEISWRAR